MNAKILSDRYLSEICGFETFKKEFKDFKKKYLQDLAEHYEYIDTRTYHKIIKELKGL